MIYCTVEKKSVFRSLQFDSSVDPQAPVLNEMIKNAAGWKSR